jgi:hypothetical protein
MVDFFNRLDTPSLDPLGDTAYPLRTASARETAGIPRTGAPVVFNGDGSQTQDALNALLSPNPMDAFRYGKQLGTSAGNTILDATGIGSFVNHALLGAMGIAFAAIGAYLLVRD